MHGQAKADAVAVLAQAQGLDLTRCSAYGDSANDIPMLSLVGKPCAVNPDGKLASHARAYGWQIRDFRTKRRAVRSAAPLLAAGAAVAGATAGALAVARRRR